MADLVKSWEQDGLAFEVTVPEDVIENVQAAPPHAEYVVGAPVRVTRVDAEAKGGKG